MSVTLLPSEILGEIFHLVTACDRVDDKLAADRLVRTLLGLTFVNSYWRSVAVGLPTLWTNIHISSTKSSPEAALTILQLHLERSASLSIDVYFVPLMEHTAEHQTALWLSLCPHLPRCRTLVIGQLVPIMAELVLPLTGSLERLQSFRLEAPLREPRPSSENSRIAFSRSEKIIPILFEAPALRELHLISHFPFWTFEWSVIKSHLCRFPCLSIAILRFWVNNDTQETSLPQPLPLPRLHTLSFANWDISIYVLLPQLKHFVPRMPAAPMLSLTQLDLVCSTAVGELMRWLAVDAASGTGAIFPNLQALHFYECVVLDHKVGESLEAAISLLQARPNLRVVWHQTPQKWNPANMPEESRERLSESSEMFPKGWML
ncbi:hypothetical protein DL93DRAFT_2094728 [Clavulina sp. PMI_390]|nr:hypothetical protein DL93DRAFT_2094728 [Clavulina sp. PMI_390]